MSDETAIVTGASGGIGAAIAKAMLERGYRVVSLALDKPDWSHPRLEAREVDLFDAKATVAVAAAVAGEHDVTHIVHNAGVIRPNAVEAATAADRAWTLFQLANCLRETNLGEAQATYTKLISEYPDSPWTDLARAQNQLVSWYLKDQPQQLAASRRP